MNKIILIGNLTRDPELTETATGVAVCRFSIAVNRNYTGADGERKTDFFNCVSWRAQGENVAKYCKKGNKVAVIGTMEQRSYEDSYGFKKTVYEVIAQEVEFLTAKSNSGYDEVGHDVPRGQERQSRPSQQLTTFDDDSDIPF